MGLKGKCRKRVRFRQVCSSCVRIDRHTWPADSDTETEVIADKYKKENVLCKTSAIENTKTKVKDTDDTDTEY